MPEHLFAFALASATLVAIPGPNTMFNVATSVASGRRAGLAAVAGTTLGTAVYVLAAAAGLAALLAASAVAYSIVKYAGAAYLIYLGVRTLLAPSDDTGRRPAVRRTPAQAFRQALVVGSTNPKVALFLVSFFPQFLTPDGNHAVQTLILGAIFLGLAFPVDALVVLGAEWIARRWRDRRRARIDWGRYASASVYLGLGAYAALSGRDHG